MRFRSLLLLIIVLGALPAVGSNLLHRTAAQKDFTAIGAEKINRQLLIVKLCPLFFIMYRAVKTVYAIK